MTDVRVLVLVVIGVSTLVIVGTGVYFAVASFAEHSSAPFLAWLVAVLTTVLLGRLVWDTLS